MLQDRFDRAVGDCADVIAASAGRLDACRAVTAGEPQDAETGAEALLGMGLGLHDRVDKGDRGGADLGCFPPHPGRRPLGLAPVRALHVLGDCRMPTSRLRAGMARQTDALVQDLDRGVGDARLEARWQHPSERDATLRCCTKSESAGAQSCSSDSSAAACAIAHLC